MTQEETIKFLQKELSKRKTMREARETMIKEAKQNKLEIQFLKDERQACIDNHKETLTELDGVKEASVRCMEDLQKLNNRCHNYETLIKDLNRIVADTTRTRTEARAGGK